MKPEKPASWLHPIDCDCDRCAPPAPRTDDRLTATQIAWWCAAGIVVGNGIAFAYSPRAALAALVAPFGVML